MNGRVAKCGFQWGNAALILGATWRVLASGSPVEVASQEHHTQSQAQITDELQESIAHRPALGAFVVHENSCHSEVLTRRVRRSPEFARFNHTLEGPGGIPVCAGNLDGSARVHVLEGVLFRSTAQ